MSGAEILSGIGMGIGVGATYGTIVDILRTGTTWAKWKAVGYKLGYPLMADVMQKIISAEKDEVHGLSSKGMIDAMWSFVDRTLDFAWIINEQIASQLFVQMIQQSIAYAIHSSHAGSIGTVCNVYSGSQSLGPMSASGVGANIDLSDRGVKSFVGASMGMNIPSFAFELNRGVNQRIEDVYRRIVTQVDSFLDEWNDLALGYYRHYHTMTRNRFQDALEMKEQIVVRAYGFLEQVANEHLARISEQLDTLEGAKAWFDAGLMSESELVEIALRVQIERVASENNFDNYESEILTGIETSVSDWDNKLQVALDDMKDCEYRYSLLINSIFETVFTDVRSFVNLVCDEADKTIEDICAYRNIHQAVKIEATDSLGEVEASPETELYRMRWGKFREIPNYTRIDETQKPRGLVWSVDLAHDKGLVVPEKFTTVPRRRFEEVDFPVVKPYTEPTPLTPWSSVG